MKKQLLRGILASTLALSFICVTETSYATEVTAEIPQHTETLATAPETDFEFFNGTITKYVGSGGDVVIPSTINGQIVTNIGESAFDSCRTIKSIVIPDTVTNISDRAFYMCYMATSLAIGNSVVNIGTEAFMNCTSLTTVSIPNSVTSIGTSAFESCNQIETISLGNSVEKIGASAFSSCISLVTINLPKTVTTIEEKAFMGCKLLSSIIIPDSVIYIGENAFSGCNNIESLTIPNSIAVIENGVFSSFKLLTSLYIPNSVTSIGKTAFSGASLLATVTIPDSVTSIGNWAFNNCYELTSIYVPSSVSEIGENVFTYYDKDTQESYPMKNLTVYGHANATVESYCKENNIPFLALNVGEYPSWVDQSVLLATTSTTVPTAPQPSETSSTGYNDVLSTDWFAPYVSFATENNLMTGQNGAFQPLLASDRGTVAQALANMSGQAQNTEVPSSYTDVLGSPYEKAIAWCLETGVMSGFDTATFGTSSNLTREQFATTLRAYSEKMGVYVAPSSTDLSGYGDGWSISEWAKTSVAWAVENGLMKGSDGNLNPQGNVNRAEVAVMLMSYSEMSNHVPEIEVPVVPEVVPEIVPEVTPEIVTPSTSLSEDEISAIRIDTIKEATKSIEYLTKSVAHLNDGLGRSNQDLALIDVADAIVDLVDSGYQAVYAQQAMTPLVAVDSKYVKMSGYYEAYYREILVIMEKYTLDYTTTGELSVNIKNFITDIDNTSKYLKQATDIFFE